MKICIFLMLYTSVELRGETGMPGHTKPNEIYGFARTWEEEDSASQQHQICMSSLFTYSEWWFGSSKDQEDTTNVKHKQCWLNQVGPHCEFASRTLLRSNLIRELRKERRSTPSILFKDGPQCNARTSWGMRLISLKGARRMSRWV